MRKLSDCLKPVCSAISSHPHLISSKLSENANRFARRRHELTINKVDLALSTCTRLTISDMLNDLDLAFCLFHRVNQHQVCFIYRNYPEHPLFPASELLSLPRFIYFSWALQEEALDIPTMHPNVHLMFSQISIINQKPHVQVPFSPMVTECYRFHFFFPNVCLLPNHTFGPGKLVVSGSRCEAPVPCVSSTACAWNSWES